MGGGRGVSLCALVFWLPLVFSFSCLCRPRFPASGQSSLRVVVAWGLVLSFLLFFFGFRGFFFLFFSIFFFFYCFFFLIFVVGVGGFFWAVSFSFLLCPVSFFVAASPASLVSSFPVVGFSGSRKSGARPALAAAGFLRSLRGSSFSGKVAVGCAAGVDSVVRGAGFPAARLSVFRVASFAGSRPVGAWAFAARSAALVRSVAAARGVLVAFPLGACPTGVAPSSSFRGCGSGSWGSVALALGLGCPVLVFVPGVSPSFPAPSVVASRFSCVGSSVRVGGVVGSWWWASAPVSGAYCCSVGVQGSLF